MIAGAVTYDCKNISSFPTADLASLQGATAASE
jgi:hypothetical protein